MTTRFGILGRAVAVTLTAGVALSVAGCGDTGNSGPGYASKDTVAQEDPADAPIAQKAIISTIFQSAVKAGSAHTTMTMRGQVALRAQGDVTYGDKASAMQMTMTMPQMGSRKLVMRYVEERLYLQIPGLTQPGKFVAIDPNDPSSPLSKGFAGLSEQMNPLSTLKSSQASLISADRVGKTSIDGVAVDHYKVVMSTAEMAKKLRQQVPRAGRLPKSISYDMWLDRRHLVRKMSFEVLGTSAEMLMTKWGKPVSVRSPAAGDIMRMPRA